MAGAVAAEADGPDAAIVNPGGLQRQCSADEALGEQLLRVWPRGLAGGALGLSDESVDEEHGCYDLTKRGTEVRVGDVYDMEEELGRGAFAFCYRASSNGQGCCMKVIEKALAGDAHHQAVKEGLCEILSEMTQKHPHENVVRFMDFFESESYYYAGMELLTGKELFEKFMEDHPVTEAYVQGIMRPVFSALQHIHEQVGLVHRDVKLDNFRFAERSTESRLVLLDFDMARRISSKGEQDISGTLLYLAPEVVKEVPPEQRQQTGFFAATDVWAAGVLLHILLTGKEPLMEREVWDLGRPGAEKLIEDVLHSNYLHYISAAGQDLVAQIFRIDPKNRITAGAALAHPWFSAVPSAATKARIPSGENLHASRDMYSLVRCVSRSSRCFSGTSLSSPRTSLAGDWPVPNRWKTPTPSSKRNNGQPPVLLRRTSSVKSTGLVRRSSSWGSDLFGYDA